ncbi:MAG TPA: KpsF/GutQ family sugar-phosphate isomerase [Pyrinomonadaceae bacterium]|nr:KpsF/GutQ family sugar-phosphate isomerase [Pyrinomonadaceae bacterium]
MAEQNHFTEFRRFLTLEAEAISVTAGRIERAEVERAVGLLSDCRGKVIVAGVGKSGNVAQKIAATLTSTGTLAVFLHPSDALHGGLGIVTPEDVVVVISNSGETEEILAMLPFLKHRHAPVIAIVGNLGSTLAARADVRLDASVDKEACPLNLAPTTSTTVALAVGDALALTLMDCKKLTPEDFALNHPAGRLGKRLMLRVGDVMHGGAQNPTIASDAPLLEVVQAISRGGLGAVNVLDGGGRLAGIITDGDLRRALQRSRLADLETLTSGDVMTRDPVVTTPDTLAYAALQLMEDRPSQISVLPVVEGEGNCVGLLRLHDIIRSGL